MGNQSCCKPPFCLVTLAALVLFALCASHFSWHLFSVWIEPLHYHWEVTVLAQFVGRRFLCVNGSLYTCPSWSLYVIGQPPLCSVLRPYGVSTERCQYDLAALWYSSLVHKPWGHVQPYPLCTSTVTELSHAGTYDRTFWRPSHSRLLEAASFRNLHIHALC